MGQVGRQAWWFEKILRPASRTDGGWMCEKALFQCEGLPNNPDKQKR